MIHDIFIGFLMISLTVLLYVGLHLNKPFPWEKKDDE